MKMKEVTKSILIPVELWERMKRQASEHSLETHTKTQTLSSVSEEPRQVYVPSKDPPQVEDHPMKGGSSDQTDMHTSLVDHFPASYRRKAKALLLYLKGVPGFSWTENGEVVIDNSTINRSNIVDLVKHASRNHKKFHPHGMLEFYTKLAQVNTPECLVDSEEGTRILKGEVKSKPPLKRKWISL